MEARIELFMMILRRNELARLAFNAWQRYDYWSDWAARIKDGQLKELCLLRNQAIKEKSIKQLDKAIKIRKKNIGFTPRSPEFMKQKLLEWTTANAAVYQFTAFTHKRRMQLQKELNTLQNKNCTNVIMSIRVGGKIYTRPEMANEVLNYEAERILLGQS